MWTSLGVIHMQKRLNVDALSGLGLVPVCIRFGNVEKRGDPSLIK